MTFSLLSFHKFPDLLDLIFGELNAGRPLHLNTFANPILLIKTVKTAVYWW